MNFRFWTTSSVALILSGSTAFAKPPELPLLPAINFEVPAATESDFFQSAVKAAPVIALEKQSQRVPPIATKAAAQIAITLVR